MCRIFEKATGIHVRLEYGNAPGTYADAIDSAIYHLAQEALINSFRHGRAGNVTVSLFEVGDAISVSIGDDGSGAPAFEEGIGLRGMRERIEKLGGELTVNGQRGGFSILARIPRNGGESCPSK
jgi:signal transduction histidine kinase